MLPLNYPQSSYKLQESAENTKASLLRPTQLSRVVVITQLKSLGAIPFSLGFRKNERLSGSVCNKI